MENVRTWVLDKNKEHYLRYKYEAESNMIYYDIYNGLCQNKKK